MTIRMIRPARHASAGLLALSLVLAGPAARAQTPAEAPAPAPAPAAAPAPVPAPAPAPAPPPAAPKLYLDMNASTGIAAPAPATRREKDPPPCRLYIAGVADKRPDTTTMGYMGGMVTSSDAAGWVRTGLVTLQADRRWTLAERPEDADVIFDVEILKGYIFPVTTSKSANLVLRVRYSQAGGPLGENVYRGHRESVNWASTREETQGLLNRALDTTVHLMKADLVKGCAAARAPKPA